MKKEDLHVLRYFSNNEFEDEISKIKQEITENYQPFMNYKEYFELKYDILLTVSYTESHWEYLIVLITFTDLLHKHTIEQTEKHNEMYREY